MRGAKGARPVTLDGPLVAAALSTAVGISGFIVALVEREHATMPVLSAATSVLHVVHGAMWLGWEVALPPYVHVAIVVLGTVVVVHHGRALLQRRRRAE
jgi:hypothetical protein